MKLELYLESVERTVKDYDFVGMYSKSFGRFQGLQRELSNTMSSLLEIR
jgi:hypothetical protein